MSHSCDVCPRSWAEPVEVIWRDGDSVKAWLCMPCRLCQSKLGAAVARVKPEDVKGDLVDALKQEGVALHSSNGTARSGATRVVPLPGDVKSAFVVELRDGVYLHHMSRDSLTPTPDLEYAALFNLRSSAQYAIDRARALPGVRFPAARVRRVEISEDSGVGDAA